MTPLVWSLFALLGAANATESAGLRELIDTFNASAHFALPTLSSEDWERLASGKIVRIIDVPDAGSGAKRATALLLVDRPRDDVWIACQDQHFSQSERVDEYNVGQSSDLGTDWFGIVDLPFPLHDRQWVVRVQNNHALALTSQNRTWEHHWTQLPEQRSLSEPFVRRGEMQTVDLERFESSIWTVDNRGAWLVLTVDANRSILGYHVTSTLGGIVPSSAMAIWIKSTLDDILEGIAERSATIRDHYTGDHRPMPGGDGAILPRW